jgi:hypothetical protein
MTRIYPDISDILVRKAEGRKNLAKRSFAEKIAWLEKFREEMQPFRDAREARRAERERVPELQAAIDNKN